MMILGVDLGVVELWMLRCLQVQHVRVSCVRWRSGRQGNGSIGAHLGSEHYTRDPAETGRAVWEWWVCSIDCHVCEPTQQQHHDHFHFKIFIENSIELVKCQRCDKYGHIYSKRLKYSEMARNSVETAIGLTDKRFTILLIVFFENFKNFIKSCIFFSKNFHRRQICPC